MWNYAHSSTLDSQPKQATRMTRYVIWYKLKHTRLLLVHEGMWGSLVARSFAIYGDAFPLDAHSSAWRVVAALFFGESFNQTEPKIVNRVAVNSQYVMLYS